MQVTTILNRVEKRKSFVYWTARWSDNGVDIEIPVRPRKGNLPVYVSLPVTGTSLRPQTIRTAVSIRAAPEHRGLVGVPDAACGVPDLW